MVTRHPGPRVPRYIDDQRLLKMARGKTIRVYPDGGVWVVKKDSSVKASAIRDTKAEALDEAKKIARNQGLSVIIHGSDGRIQRTVRPGDPGTDDCFITTACVQYNGLSDDCKELTLLRAYRDNHLASTPLGLELIDEYYDRAPLLVQQLNQRIDRKSLYDELFERIRAACNLIECGQPERATIEYKNAVVWLHSVVG